MLNNIRINSVDLETIDKELIDACDKYQEALKDLDSNITKLTGGGFQGTLADVLLQKYEEKKPALEKIGQQAEEIKEFSKRKTRDFYQVIDETKRIIH